jgi:hypothetical protein
MEKYILIFLCKIMHIFFIILDYWMIIWDTNNLGFNYDDQSILN